MATASLNPGVANLDAKKERAMKRWTLLLVAAMLAMSAPAFSPGPAFSEDKVVHFSSINGQTGQSAAYGSKVIEGVNLAAKTINDAGGFNDKCGTHYKLKITTGDMANSREQAVSLLRQAVSDASVLAVIGPSPSTGYVPMVPVAGQLKIAVIATGSAAPIKEWNPWAFRLNTVSKVAAPAVMRTLKGKFDLKRVALIYDVTQDGQRGEAELIRNAAKDVGYEVAAFEAFRAGDNDFRPQLSKIKAAKPDWIGIYGATPELAKVVNQMAELGIKAGMITGFGTFNDPVAWDLTEGRVKSGYSWSAYFALEDPARPEVGKMVQAFKKEYGHDPTLYSFYGWDAVHVFVEAVRRACTATDREKFRQALNTIDNFAILSGNATFKNPPDGENLTAAVIVNQTTGRGAFEVVK
jgi:branched-chain amino acid transport system substrate-binding protein